MKMISLLRGINVSGQKKIKMADLRALYEDWGFSDVSSYIQSGNVIFSGSGWQVAAAQKKIVGGIKLAYGFDVPVVIRTATEWDKIIAQSPFGEFDVAAEGSKYAVTFLSAKPDAQGVVDLQERAVPPERLIVLNREIYSHCPAGFGQTKLTINLMERLLKVSATARNWKTVLKLQSMAKT